MKIRSNRAWRLLLLAAAIIAFSYYFSSHQSQFARLADLQWWQIGLVVAGQAVIYFSNVMIAVILVRYIGRKLPLTSAARLTAYSSLVNFFGFLQGGVGLRGVFFKQKFGMKYRQYTALTMLQYLLLFGVSALLVLLGLSLAQNPLAAMVVLLVVVSVAIALVAARRMTTLPLLDRLKRLAPASWLLSEKRLLTYLGLMILLQLAGALLAYGVELQAVGANISPGGLLVYTGVSQFSVVIALTPGAIGIREGLLLLVQSQMSITTQDIILASVIDRGVYVLMLALMAVMTLVLKDKLVKS